jgi:solute carrier family 45, member 1/2/4
MPKELKRLLFMELLGWIAYFFLTFFITDFVGQEIYHGNPLADPASAEYLKYSDGVKMGCWCLFSVSIVAAISAIIIEKYLTDLLEMKTILFFANLVFAICTGIIYFQTNVYVILVLVSTMGIYLTSLQTIPYQMLSMFHDDDVFRSKSASGSKRGIGVDCSLVTAIYFLSQAVVAALGR